MARGRQAAEWDRTALLAAIGANPFRDAKKHRKPFSPSDFHPFMDRKQSEPKEIKIKISVECLKGLCRHEGLGTGD